MNGRYILEGHTPVPVEDVLEWARWLECNNRVISKTMVGNVQVSTVFLGLDHNVHGEGPPLLFETMTFRDGDTSGDEQWRCSTWDEAVAQHAEVVAAVKRELS